METKRLYYFFRKSKGGPEISSDKGFSPHINLFNSLKDAKYSRETRPEKRDIIIKSVRNTLLASEEK